MASFVPVKDSWKFCPACGKSPQQTGLIPFRCGNSDCGYTHYFSPNTAVGALIVDSDGAMLFIVRAKEPGKGKLGLPGGFVDAGESAERAVIREIEEEINLEITGIRYLASFPNEYRYKGVVSPVTDLFYVAEVKTLQGMKAQPGEIDGWKFVPVDEVDSDHLAFDTHRLALECYLKPRP